MENEKIVYFTNSGIEITRTKEILRKEDEIQEIAEKLQKSRGAIFASDYSYPERYSRWEIAFTNPPIEIRCKERNFNIRALNNRGEILLKLISEQLKRLEYIETFENSSIHISGLVHETDKFFSEEERSKQPSVFSIIREIISIFYSQEDDKLGLYGAFGYDLVFQFEPSIKHKKKRENYQEDLVLFLPDRFTVVDNKLGSSYVLNYEFKTAQGSTKGLLTDTKNLHDDNEHLTKLQNTSTKLGQYASLVTVAKESFKKGDLFEVVPSHVLSRELAIPVKDIFENLRNINPSPYTFFINLGTQHLIGCSPEMYVRVEGNRVETCPISGTIKRGKDILQDAEQIKILLNSTKEESELTMCTDVDRNDKSRICIPGSVKVIGRRQIEMYSHLIHTVDHVEGILEPKYDAIDAFLTHMWAVTVTGAPKRSAIEWIEEHENSPREWYGGAIGFMLFNGNMNTGLTLRTVRVKDNIAQVRVGATLLMDSEPEAEEEETYTKAAVLLESVLSNNEKFNKDKIKNFSVSNMQSCKGKKILIIDHEDSFVNTIGNYIKQLGAEVTTLRSDLARKVLKEGLEVDGILLSPGPGLPDRFNMKETIDICLDRKLPILGVCLGIQGLVQYFGGTLAQIPYPRHGKKMKINTDLSCSLWDGIGESFYGGLYHSIYCESIPECLKVVARDEEGIVMGIEHKELPIIAVQFHPESILTANEDVGLKLLNNVFDSLFV